MIEHLKNKYRFLFNTEKEKVLKLKLKYRLILTLRCNILSKYSVFINHL